MLGLFLACLDSYLLICIDIINCMFRFDEEEVKQLDRNKKWSRALDGSDYLPGMVSVIMILC